MPSDLSTIDLATINAAQSVIVAALRNQCCQWEQDSADAAADGRLANALMIEHWAFAADLLAGKVGSEFSALFGRALDARINLSDTTRSVEKQMLDVLALEVAASQEAPEKIAIL
ncbi:hypothetical protein KQ298_10485 [Synechococcus sp. CS-1330]|nr:hypothetical protein [Synechococcus sp. CS-1330]